LILSWTRINSRRGRSARRASRPGEACFAVLGLWGLQRRRWVCREPMTSSVSAENHPRDKCASSCELLELYLPRSVTNGVLSLLARSQPDTEMTGAFACRIRSRASQARGARVYAALHDLFSPACWSVVSLVPQQHTVWPDVVFDCLIYGSGGQIVNQAHNRNNSILRSVNPLLTSPDCIEWPTLLVTFWQLLSHLAGFVSNWGLRLVGTGSRNSR